MRRLAVLLLLGSLAGCEQLYSVNRTTPVGAALAWSQLQDWASHQPDFRHAYSFTSPAEGYVIFERGVGSAYIDLGAGNLTVCSYETSPPSADRFRAWLRLQADLIASLRQQFPFLPAQADWRTTCDFLEDWMVEEAGRGADTGAQLSN